MNKKQQFSFASKVTQKILGYFFINPDERLYLNELARRFQLDKRNLGKKLQELEKTGLMTAQKLGNMRLYSINQKFPLYEEYRRIFLKTVGLEGVLKQIIAVDGDIDGAYLYGSYARDKLDSHSDIDLLVVGGHDILSLQKKLNRLQKSIGREINIVNMDQKEFNKRKKTADPFITGVLKNPYIKIK